MSIPVLLIFVTLLIAGSGGADPYVPTHTDPMLEPWRWRSYPELKAQGLRCLVEGADKTMWFGTDKGIMHYDGLNWITYTPEDGVLGTPINALNIGPDGSVYAGSDVGISQFKNGHWQRVFPKNDNLPWPIDRLIHTTDGTLWAATAWGALHLSREVPRLYTSQDMVKTLAQLAPSLDLVPIPDSALPARSWRESLGEGIGVKVVKGSFLAAHRGNAPMVVWAVAPGGPGAKSGLQIGDRILSVNGNMPDQPSMAFGGPEGTSMKLQIERAGQNAPFEVLVTRTSVPGHILECALSDVFQANDGSMWFGLSWGGEILKGTFSPSKDLAWQLFTATDGLDPGVRPRITQTPDHAIWTASMNGQNGVNRYQNGIWTTFDLHDLNGNNINPSILSVRNGAVWVGGHAGALYVFDKGIWSNYTQANQPLPDTRIIDMYQTSDNVIWVAGLGQEAIRFDYGPTRWTTHQNLRFRAEAPDGSLWFITQDRQHVVCKNGDTWTRYGQKDGLIDISNGLMATRQGDIWVAGSHHNRAATAQFDFTTKTWQQYHHPQLAQAIDPNGLFQAQDNALWFSAFGVFDGHQGGVLQFNGQTWQHNPGSESILHAYAIAQTPDGTLWFGGPSLRYFDGTAWQSVTQPEPLNSWVHDMNVTREGTLWVGTRHHGVFCFSGQTWQQYSIAQGLQDTYVLAISGTTDSNIWVATTRGLSHFDGRTWDTTTFPENIRIDERGGLYITRNRDIWINTEMGAIQYIPDNLPPKTRITLCPKTVAQPGNTVISWDGTDPWRDTPNEALQYAVRLDDGEWSDFSMAKTEILQALPTGVHTLFIKARDQDFNEDPTPAQATFTVLPPIWRHPFFMGISIFALSIIIIQATRIVRRDRDLAITNHKLTQEMAERETRDGQIANLQYLYSLRTALGETHRPTDVVQTVGNMLAQVLDHTGMIAITLDTQTQTFGTFPDSENGHGKSATHSYTRTLSWGDRERGTLQIKITVPLSESQERTLLDETTGQLTRTLEARELQMQLYQSSRLVALGQMAAGMAHELNQPLGGISATAEDYYLRLQEGIDVSEDQLKAAFAHLLGMVDRMSNIIQHLRIFSRDTSNDSRQSMNLNTVINTSLTLIGTQLKNHGIALTLDLLEALPHLVGHPYQLEQIFLNLLGNARDALKAKTFEIGGIKKIIIRTRQDHNHIIAEVEDNGQGISTDHLDRIFEPFFTTKNAEEGTGLGLSITYAIVKNHGGDITCQSRIGQGTTFRVTFPIAT